MLIKELKQIIEDFGFADDDHVLIAIDITVPMDVLQACALKNKEHEHKGLLLSSMPHDTLGKMQ